MNEDHHALWRIQRRRARSVRRNHVRSPFTAPLSQRRSFSHHGSSSDNSGLHTFSYSNTVQSMQAVLEALPLLSVVLLPASNPAADLIEELDPDERSTSEDVKNALLVLWRDPAVLAALGESPSCFARRAPSSPDLVAEVKSRFQISQSNLIPSMSSALLLAHLVTLPSHRPSPRRQRRILLRGG